MIDKTQIMGLSDIFDYSFNLLKAILSKALRFSAIFIIPAGALALFIYTVMAPTANDLQLGENAPGVFAATMVMLFYLVMLFLSIGSQLIQIGILKLADKSLAGEQPSLSDMFNVAFSIAFWRIVLMYILMLLPIIGIVIIIGILAVLLADLIGGGASGVILLLIIPTYVAIFYFAIAWMYGKTIIVSENAHAAASLKRSYRLVKGNWWRTFGRTILFGLIEGLASMLISLPIAFFVFGGDVLANFPQQGSQDVVAMALYLVALFKMIILVYIISMFVTSIITPVYQLVTLYDLRIRNNEFAVEIPTVIEQVEIKETETDWEARAAAWEKPIDNNPAADENTVDPKDPDGN